jgi:antitoxin VapB
MVEWWSIFHHITNKRVAVALNIKNPEADALAHELAAATGESLTEAVTEALRARLEAVRRRAAGPPLLAEVAQLQGFLRDLPDRDSRPPDALLGYDSYGLPT